MYRMQGETSSPEVSGRVSKSALQESPFALSLQALQKVQEVKDTCMGETSVQRTPNKQRSRTVKEEPGRQGMIRQTQNLIAPFFLIGWRHMQILKCIQVRSQLQE